ncbi:MAG: hypothetical protein KAS95_06135 [Candidatus Heimdallarchaeota archaeon]|nr:hypothetical protein [Candidatus Heimdallarchaeota archaeon]
MHSSLISLLKKTASEIGRKRFLDDNVTGVILGCIDTEKILDVVRKLKLFCSEIVIGMTKKEYKVISATIQENSILPFKIKILPNNYTLNLKIMDQLVKESSNNQILFTSLEHDIAFEKYKCLCSYDSPLTTFIGCNGNVIPSICFYDRWYNRFFLQLLILRGRKNLDDIFRISPNFYFLKMSSKDFIKKYQNDSMVNSNYSDIKQFDYFPKKILFNLEIQDIIQLIALLRSLTEELEKLNIIKSKFKVQQILILSKKFAKAGNKFLASQITLFLLDNKEAIDSFPLDWSMEKITNLARKNLLEESEYLAMNGFEKLRIRCLEDLTTYDLLKESEKEWFEKEKMTILDKLTNDNIEFS